MRIKDRPWFLMALILAGMMIEASCSGSAPVASVPSQTVKPTAARTYATPTPTLTNVPTLTIVPTLIPTTVPTKSATPTPSPRLTPTAIIELASPSVTVTAGAGEAGQKINLDEIAPPGHARDLVMMNCGGCHSFVCAFRGQRTLQEWQLVKQDMRHEVSALSDEDYNTLFAYLEENFNDKKPEPNLPPELQQLGCNYGTQ